MTGFMGLVQHSFALRLADSHQPFDGHSTHETVSERFGGLEIDDGGRFYVSTLNGDEPTDEADFAAAHSLLTTTHPALTPVVPRPVRVLDSSRTDDRDALPPALSWAGPGEAARGCGDRTPRPRMIFAELEETSGRTSANDFLVKFSRQDAKGKNSERVARALLEAVAFRRSQLFGLAIANRFVNVMLPCATLTPDDGTGAGAQKPLLLLALVSLMRDGTDRRGFRRMYSLTLYALPVEEPGEEQRAREMEPWEIASIVNAGWGLADALTPEAVPRYRFEGPLDDYVACLARPGAVNLLFRAENEGALSFRMVTELIAYATALRMAEGSSGAASDPIKRSLGKDVVTTLGTARVSAAVVVDPDLEPKDVESPIWATDPPGSLKPLTKTLAPGVRVPETWMPRQRRKLRLDRPFIDSENHAIGIIPANRCLLVAYARKEVRADPVPLLSLVGGVTFMTVGTATAIGTLRSIDRDLEQLERQDPRKIAEIDCEVATDLHEIYDLDIANETYRNLYRRLRDRLGITRDYKTLQDKMQTLYRATSTFHDDREQKQLAWLTAAIVILSVLILIGTIVGATLAAAN